MNPQPPNEGEPSDHQDDDFDDSEDALLDNGPESSNPDSADADSSFDELPLWRAASEVRSQPNAHPTSDHPTFAEPEYWRRAAGDRPSGRLPAIPPADRFLGVVLAAAIGDALGHPTEFIGSWSGLFGRYPGGLKDYDKFWTSNGIRFAPYTDDTQMAICVAEGLLEASPHDPEDFDATMTAISRRVVDWSRNPPGGHRAPGGACMAGARALASGARWDLAGGATAGGCGSAMRSYPFGLWFWKDREVAARWAAEGSKMTHRDPIALAGSAAMAAGVVAAMHEEDADKVISAMIDAAAVYCGNTAGMITTAADQARSGISPREALQRWQGWAAHEAAAAAAYVFRRHPDDMEGGLLEGAFSPGDSDSIATLAGALLGARLGFESIPAHWIERIENRAALQELGARLWKTRSTAG